MVYSYLSKALHKMQKYMVFGIKKLDYKYWIYQYFSGVEKINSSF